MTASIAHNRRLGIIGSIVGLLALMAAILPQWVIPMVAPPPPVDQVVVDTGSRVKDRLIARLKGVEYQAPHREPSLGSRLHGNFSLAAITLGLLAIALAVFSVIFREEKLLAGVSATLGVCAIAVEVSMFLIGVLFVLAILYIVSNMLDWF
ncbi:hypothetical protein [Bradyrhizobium sp. CCBAU 51753]|uniref:hypothetical protein n=1 Tax=Bradyrhizobium sp. CCBAU 51753 TaxID=1325100 RepID=UPI001889CC78|nr:hypothetical protein [Bradyrhizobium sp. CCBAU 51753]QOZ26919.1 hypothetical protein XH93_27380 [Bradyrhizobium sp. CCBAU 51753]